MPLLKAVKAAAFLVLITLSVSSCNNLVDSPSSGGSSGSSGSASEIQAKKADVVYFNGKIEGLSAYPEEIAETVPAQIGVQSNIKTEGSETDRSALPSKPDTSDSTKAYYYLTSTSDDGTVMEQNPLSVNEQGYFAISLSLNHSWNIEVGIKAKNTIDGSEEFVTVLSSSYQSPVLSTEDPVVFHQFILTPTAEGYGSLELELTGGTYADSFTVKVQGDEQKAKWEAAEGLTIDVSTGKISADKIASGVYEIAINFTKGGIPVYTALQTITVLDGMKTNHWISGGGVSPINASGEFILTEAVLKQFKRTTFYVGDTSVASATDTGDGSSSSPVTTLSRAISIMNAQKVEAASDYKIFVSGPIEGITEISDSIDSSKATGITIMGMSGSATDILDGKQSGTVLTIKTAVPITLKNIKVTGGKATNGGGIKMASGTKLTLDSGTVIGDDDTSSGAAKKASCANYAYTLGGGIYMEAGTLIVKNGAKICRNYSGSGRSASATPGSSGGGGICCVKDASVTLESGSAVSYNGTDDRGGGIYLSGETGKIPVLNMNGADVSHNEIVGWGGGIYMGGSSNVKVTINNSTVSYNKTTGTHGYGPCGGAFFVDIGELTVKGNSVIEGNESYYGGGAYNGPGERSCIISFEGGTIRNNTSATGAGGFDLKKGNTYNFSGSVYIPHGIDGDTSAGKNGLVLCEDAVITVAGNLVAPADGSKNAYITPVNWNRGTQVLTAATAKLIEDNASKFGTADDDFEVVARNTAGIIDAPIYVASFITTGAGARKLCTGEPSSDDDARGTRAKPFATMSQALTLLTDSTVDYEIRIDGTISGRNAHTAITSTKQAASVLIHGANGDNANDALNQNNLGVSNNGGSVLVINNDIPVTIKNLKITGGNANGSSGDSANGGGIFVKKGSLCLDDGAFITKNSAASSGGGVYVEKDTNLYMCGTAKIGGTGSGEGNTAQMGGGLYNKQGFVYLGKSSGSTESELTGGIYGNTSTKEGGGISISGSGYNVVNLEMLSGNIEGNKVDVGTSGGGGVYLYCTVFDLKGGVIKNNSIENPGTSTSGGAININTVATLKIGGSVSIPYGGSQYKNDIAQKSSNTIELSSALNENFSAAVVANSYEVDSEILSGTASLLSSECYKFYVPKPDSVEEQLFVLDDGKLGPIVTYPNGTSDGTETKDGLTYTVMKYSFKNYDNLQMNVLSAYTDNGFVELKVDGSVPENAAILDDGYHTVTVTLSNYMSEPIVIEKRMYVKIKPIRLLYQNLEWGQIGAQYVCFANWVTDRVHIRGQVKVNGTTIFDCQSYNYEINPNEWYNLDWEMTGRKFDHTFSSKTEELSLFFNIWRNADTPGTAGAHTITRTLADIKKVNVSKCGSGTSDSVEDWCLWSENQTNPSGAPSPTIAVKVKFNTYE